MVLTPWAHRALSGDRAERAAPDAQEGPIASGGGSRIPPKGAGGPARSAGEPLDSVGNGPRARGHSVVWEPICDTQTNSALVRYGDPALPVVGDREPFLPAFSSVPVDTSVAHQSPINRRTVSFAVCASNIVTGISE